MRFFLLLLAALSFSAVAQVYKWTDENGNVHFGTQPPPGQQEEVKIRDTKSSPPSQTYESDILRQARELEERKAQERYQTAEQRYQERVAEVAEGYEERPDYICTGARNRLKSAEERWEDQQLQGWSLSEKRYHEQRIRDLQRHADNVCR